MQIMVVRINQIKVNYGSKEQDMDACGGCHLGGSAALVALLGNFGRRRRECNGIAQYGSHRVMNNLSLVCVIEV